MESKLSSSIKLDWDWAMPMLRKAVIQLKGISEKNHEAIFNMLYAVANVQELHINIMESRNQIDTFHALLLPGVDLPTFFDLKHCKLEICFHEYNVEDLVTILQHSPALESLELVHKPLLDKDKKRKLWRSRLPQSIDGHHLHAYFEDLHIPGMKLELQSSQSIEGKYQRGYFEDIHIPGMKLGLQPLQNIEGKYQHAKNLQLLGRKEQQQLLQHIEDNYQHAYFEDLHILGRKEELLRYLITKRSLKRLKTGAWSDE